MTICSYRDPPSEVVKSVGVPPVTKIDSARAPDSPSVRLVGTPFFQYLAKSPSHPAIYTSDPDTKIEFPTPSASSSSYRLVELPFSQYCARNVRSSLFQPVIFTMFHFTQI